MDVGNRMVAEKILKVRKTKPGPGRNPKYDPDRGEKVLRDYEAVGAPVKEFASRRGMTVTAAEKILAAARSRRHRQRKAARGY